MLRIKVNLNLCLNCIDEDQTLLILINLWLKMLSTYQIFNWHRNRGHENKTIYSSPVKVNNLEEIKEINDSCVKEMANDLRSGSNDEK